MSAFNKRIVLLYFLQYRYYAYGDTTGSGSVVFGRLKTSRGARNCHLREGYSLEGLQTEIP